jgi:hypothetical protein
MKTMHLKWKPRQVAHGFPRVISVSARNNTGDKKCQEKKSAEKRTQNGPNWSCANGMSCGTNGMESACFFVSMTTAADNKEQKWLTMMLMMIRDDQR